MLGRGLVAVPRPEIPDGIALTPLQALEALAATGALVPPVAWVPVGVDLAPVLARLRPDALVEVFPAEAFPAPEPERAAELRTVAPGRHGTLVVLRTPAVHVGTLWLRLHRSDDVALAHEPDDPDAVRRLLVPRVRRGDRPHRGPDGTPLPPWAQRLSVLVRRARATLPRGDHLLRFADDGQRCRLLAAAAADPSGAPVLPASGTLQA